MQHIARDQVYQSLKQVLRERYLRAAEAEITLTADSLRQGVVKLDKWLWKKILIKLYKGPEERASIEQKVHENIAEINSTIGS